MPSVFDSKVQVLTSTPVVPVATFSPEVVLKVK